MKTDPKAQGKLLDRQLHGVLKEEDASFLEADSRLFPLEKDLLDQIRHDNLMRRANGEKTCHLPPIVDGTGVIGGFCFRNDHDLNVLLHESDNFTIHLLSNTFLSDAQTVLSDIHGQRDLLARIGPTVVRIGFLPTVENWPVASCNPATGTINILADEHGGLLIAGFVNHTKNDSYPIIGNQIVIQELTHLLKGNGPLTKRVEESTHRDVVKTFPGPDISGIHFEYAGDRLAYKLESSEGSEG